MEEKNKKKRQENGSLLRLAEMTPGFCHYLRFINEAPLLVVADTEKFHHYSRIDGETRPGILDEFDTDESGRIHTFAIQKDLLWSDGKPVTTEDVRYAVEDVLLLPEMKKYLTNSENSEIMLPEWEWLFWGEKPVILHVLDERRFALEFSRPCYGFIPMQVRSARWQMLIRPSHYLKPFHFRYADREALLRKKKEDGFECVPWEEYYHAVDPPIREAGYFVPERVMRIWDYPTLDPWMHTGESSPEHYILIKNPHFFMRDKKGVRLPYIRKIVRDYCPDKEVLGKRVEDGCCDVAGLFFKQDDPLMSSSAAAERYRRYLLKPWQVQQAVFLINLCPEQEWLRPFVQDRRFRQAVSLTLDRKRMIREVFAGDGVPSQIAPAEDRPYYEDRFACHNAEYDPERSNRLFNDLGICYKKEEDTVRYFPNGEKAELEMVYYLVTPMAEEAVQFFQKSLRKAGISLKITRLKNGAQMGAYQVRNRHIFSVWEMPGDDPFIPYQIGGLSDPCPLYWKWYETGGKEGVEPIAEVKTLYKLRDGLKTARTAGERYALARKIYELQSENLWVIGTASGVRQPFLVKKKFQTGLKDGQSTVYSALSSVKEWTIREEDER